MLPPGGGGQTLDPESWCSPGCGQPCLTWPQSRQPGDGHSREGNSLDRASGHGCSGPPVAFTTCLPFPTAARPSSSGSRKNEILWLPSSARICWVCAWRHSPGRLGAGHSASRRVGAWSPPGPSVSCSCNYVSSTATGAATEPGLVLTARGTGAGTFIYLTQMVRGRIGTALSLNAWSWPWLRTPPLSGRSSRQGGTHTPT